jgi:hypothetical protein
MFWHLLTRAWFAIREHGAICARRREPLCEAVDLLAELQTGKPVPSSTANLYSVCEVERDTGSVHILAGVFSYMEASDSWKLWNGALVRERKESDRWILAQELPEAERRAVARFAARTASVGMKL